MSKNAVVRRPQQLNLFRPQPKIPIWNLLPVEAKQEVKTLLARLFRQHRAGRLEIQRQQEARDE